jgi:hypothetical protein
MNHVFDWESQVKEICEDFKAEGKEIREITENEIRHKAKGDLERISETLTRA